MKKDFFNSLKGKWLCVIILFSAWILLHIFTLGWDLPAAAEHAADSMIPTPGLSASEMISNNTYKYPPLQYWINSAVAPNVSKIEMQAMSPQNILNLTGKRIFVFRSVTAVMELGIVLLIFLLGSRIFCMSSLSAFFAAMMFQLCPAVLYYSHTTNMDIPYLFWGMTAFAAAAFGVHYESEHKKKKEILCHLLCGVLIGFAFCTKDQVYAYMFLPAFYLVWLRRKNGFLCAVKPLLLWTVPFIVTVLAVCMAAGGFSGYIRPHFEWIFGAGKSDFYQFGSGLTDRFKLLAFNLGQLGQVMDYALILFFLFLFGYSLAKKRFLDIPRSIKLFFIGFVILFFSAELLLFQVLRAGYVRFMIPFLPFLCLGLIMVLDFLKQRKQAVQWVLVPVLIIQIASGIQTLSFLKYSNVRELTGYLRQNDRLKKLRAVTATANEGFLFSADKSGKILPKKAIRSWQAETYLFHTEYVPDILPNDFFLRAFAPDVLIASDTNLSDPVIVSWLQKGIFLPVRNFAHTSIIPSMWNVPQTSFVLLARNLQGPFPSSDQFPKMTISEQLMNLTYLLKQVSLSNPQGYSVFGSMLAPYTVPDFEHYYISRKAMEFAHKAYHAAGRLSDAHKISQALK